MPPRTDAPLQTALDQRRQTLEQTQLVMSLRDRATLEQSAAVAAAESRVRLVLRQIDAAQQPAPGVALPVALLGELEQLLDWCEVQVVVQQERLHELQAESEEARGWVAAAHQQVKSLEVVLARRAAERAEVRRRAENREADEIAARVHARGLAAV